MTSPPKKGSLAILIAPKGKVGGMGRATPSDPEEGGEDPSSLEMAAQELIKAVKSGDVQSVADALRAAHEACSSEGY